MKKVIYVVLAVLAVICAACGSNGNGWTLSGKVEGANEGKIALEKFVNGIWVVEDSISLGSNGDFS